MNYDVLHRTTSINGPFVDDTVSTSYDDVARSSSLSVQDASPVTYAYDALDRLQSVTSGAGVFNYSYSGNSDMLSELGMPNGSKSLYSYDGLQRLTGVGNRKADNSLISGYSYGYDLPGHKDARSWMQAQVGSGPLTRTDYSYDSVDQLTQEVLKKPALNPDSILSKSYAYDAMGNRTQVQSSQTATVNGTTSTTSWSTSSTANRLNQLTQQVHTPDSGAPTTSNLLYDAAGNLTSVKKAEAQGGSTYTYDEEDRLTSIVQQDEATGVNQRKSEFVYDGFSRKVISREFTWDSATSAWVQQSEVRRLYDGMDVVQERDGNNAVTVNYTRDGNIGGLLARSTSEGHFFYHYDGSGNVSQLTDAAQATVATYEYDAYGVLLSSSGPQAGQPYRYSTKELHAASGLYDYGYRFYSPGMGRWLNRDPIAESGGINLYGFVGNDPINTVDEYGLKKVVLCRYWNWGANPRDVRRVKRATERMFRSPRGRQLVRMIIKRGYPVDIYVNNSNRNESWPVSGIVDNRRSGVWVDPTDRPWVWVGRNGRKWLEEMPLEALMSHEIGHDVTGYRDNTSSRDPIGDNVRWNENPTRRWFGWPLRVEY